MLTYCTGIVNTYFHNVPKLCSALLLRIEISQQLPAYVTSKGSLPVSRRMHASLLNLKNLTLQHLDDYIKCKINLYQPGPPDETKTFYYH
jgi:hypothetical protein